MGLPIPVAEAILAEHCYKKIVGDVLFIGRQTVFLDESTLKLLLSKYGLSVPAGFVFEFDRETRGVQGGQGFITDRCFLRSIGVENVNFLDVSGYEGADVVHDLGYPVPDSLLNRYDFVYNGSCLDNMFNPGVAMANLSKMLRPGGRIVCLEHASSLNGPYLMFSPGWFWDYYVTNAFADCKTYLGSFSDNDDLSYGPWKWHYVNLTGSKCTWQETNGPSPVSSANNHFMIVSIAEKGTNATAERQPIQLQYRTDDVLIQEYQRNAEAIRLCPRPIIMGRKGQVYDQYLTLLGKIGVGVHTRSFADLARKIARRYLRPLKRAVIAFLGR